MARTFEDMTPEEFLRAVNGYLNRKDEEIPADQFFQLAAQEIKKDRKRENEKTRKRDLNWKGI